MSIVLLDVEATCSYVSEGIFHFGGYEKGIIRVVLGQITGASSHTNHSKSSSTRRDRMPCDKGTGWRKDEWIYRREIMPGALEH